MDSCICSNQACLWRFTVHPSKARVKHDMSLQIELYAQTGPGSWHTDTCTSRSVRMDKVGECKQATAPCSAVQWLMDTLGNDGDPNGVY